MKAPDIGSDSVASGCPDCDEIGSRTTHRWIRNKNHKASPHDAHWRDHDWLLLDGDDVSARTCRYEHGPQAGR